MKSKIILGLLALFLMPSIIGGTEVSIFPGQNYTVECNITDENVSVYCTPQNVCRVNRTLLGNETYNFSEGVCDLYFHCPGIPSEREGDVEFPMILKIQNDNKTTQVNLTIWDWVGNIHENRTYSMRRDDIGYQEYRSTFECPAEIKTEINLQTCSKFMNQILQTGDPLLFQLATGQTACTQELIECQSEVKATESKYNDYKVEFQGKTDEVINMKAQLTNCMNELDAGNPNSTISYYIKETSEVKKKMVEPFYMYGFYVLVAILVLLLLGVVFKTFW